MTALRGVIPAGLLILRVAMAAAQSPTGPDPATLAARETSAWRLIASLQSPFCPGLTLDSCPSWYADSLRTEIRQRMAAGESPEAIRDQLARDFGQRILGEPTWRGFDVLGWIGPGVLLLLGGSVLAMVVRQRGRRTPSPAAVVRPEYVPALVDIPPSERARLEQQLQAELRQQL
jgi:cytochrome c-type biogenesis protein CcmH